MWLFSLNNWYNNKIIKILTLIDSFSKTDTGWCFMIQAQRDINRKLRCKDVMC